MPQTPSSYTNFGTEVDVCAPGGDTEYYNAIGQEDDEFWENNEVSGSILSTMTAGVAAGELWLR